MSKAVFILNHESIYDDLPERHYHFPKLYLSRVQKTVGDWIIYYESGKKKGRKSYFATARVNDIQPDSREPNLFYAHVKDFLPFSNPVPLRDGDFIHESTLRGDDGEIRGGAAQSAVRPIPENEYQQIVQMGFGHVLKSETDLTGEEHNNEMSEEQAIVERPIIEQIVRRPFREAAFAKNINDAYEKTCAMTGIKIINGGGRAEVHAAHIQPVEKNGPDSVRNGLALSRTIHWMFDRGLISVSDDHKILTVKNKVPKEIEQLLRPSREIILPKKKDLFPHTQFLRYHREHIYKG